MKGSKDCIVNSHGLESASTTADHDARPNSKELHWKLSSSCCPPCSSICWKRLSTPTKLEQGLTCVVEGLHTQAY